MADRISHCSVREGRFVDPCTALHEMIAGEAVGNRKGILVWSLVDTRSLKPSRNMIGARSGDVHKNGVVFNFCPFCGTDISAPFMGDEGSRTDA